jgi:undecaprenyl-diphosphatase
MTRIGDAVAAARREPPIGFVRRPLYRASMLALAVAGVALCMLIVRSGEVGAAERAVFRAINGLPDGLRAPLWVFQLFGMLASVAVVAVVATAMSRYRLGIALALAIPIKLMVEWWVIKAIVERERPAFTVPDAIVRDVNTAPLGFPSGHAVFAFAIAGLVAPYLGRRGTVVAYALAVLNSLARVYLGAHNPLDVVAGAFVGVAIAAVVSLTVGEPESCDAATGVE